MNRWTPITATLLLLVTVVSLAGIVQGALFPNNEVLNEGTGVAGSFPNSIETLDSDYRQYAPTLATPSHIRLTYEFDLNQRDNHRLYIYGRGDSNSGQGEFRFRVVPSATYTSIPRGVGDELYVWDLTNAQGLTKPVKVEFEFTCVPGGVDCEESALYLDKVYIESWDDGGIVPPDEPPPDEPPDGGDTGDWEFDWLILLYTITVVILAFSLTWKGSGSIPLAVVIAVLVGILFFLFMSGLIWTLLIPGVVTR